MNKKTKGFLYNFIAFAIFFFVFKYILSTFFGLKGIVRALLSFGLATFLAPKFQCVGATGKEKLYMQWIFIKGVKEIK